MVEQEFAWSLDLLFQTPDTAEFRDEVPLTLQGGREINVSDSSAVRGYLLRHTYCPGQPHP